MLEADNLDFRLFYSIVQHWNITKELDAWLAWLDWLLNEKCIFNKLTKTKLHQLIPLQIHGILLRRKL